MFYLASIQKIQMTSYLQTNLVAYSISQYEIDSHHYISPLYGEKHWDFPSNFKLLRLLKLPIKSIKLEYGDTSCFKCKCYCKHGAYIYILK